MNHDSSSGLNLQDLSGTGSQLGLGQDFMTDMLTQQVVLIGNTTALSVIEQLNLMSQSPYKELQSHKEVKSSPLATGPGLDQNPVLRDEVLAVFRQGLQVVPIKNTRLMSVSYTDTDPFRAAAIANTTVDAYLLNHTEERFEATAKASSWLRKQLDDLKRRVEDTHKQVAQYEKDKGIVEESPAQGASKLVPGGTIDGGAIALQELSALSSALTRAEVDRIAKEAVYRLAQTGDPNVILSISSTTLANSPGSPTALSATNKDMQIIQSLRTQESALEVRLASQQVQYGAQNPIVVELKAQLATIHKQLQDEVAVTTQQARTDFELAKSNEDAMHRTVDQHERDFATLGNNLSELSFLRQEETSTRVLYQDLYNRLEEANIAAGVKSSGVSIVDPARTPSALSSPRFSKDLSYGFLAGAFLGIFIAIGLQFLDRSLRTPEAIDAVSGYPLLGVVPSFLSNSGNRKSSRFFKTGSEVPAREQKAAAWVENAPKSQIAEAYRQIRTAILLSNPDSIPRVLLVTSSLSGDGKSTTAYNLAATLAQQSKRVVLIDADMRRPSIAPLIGLSGKQGLSTILYSDTSIDEVLQVHPKIDSLFVITSGAIPPSPSEMVGSERFAKVLEDLRKRFEYVIIDSPPALLVTDAVLIGRHVDGVVGVIRAGKITSATLRRFWNTLSRPGVSILGYVLNDFDVNEAQYGYYGYSGYYGSDNTYFERSENKS
jgi:capsular exopolysaccharide synthesis family protein